MRFKAKSGRLTRDDLDGLLNEYYPRIFNYLYYRTLDRALSDDLVGTVMLNVVRKYETFDPERGNLDAWIFRIARNTLFSYFRKSKIEVDLDAVPQMTLSYEDEDALDDKGEMVRGLLEVLTDDERELVYLKYWEELSNKEIAERLGLNPSTVSTNLWRANNKMRKAMPND